VEFEELGCIVNSVSISWIVTSYPVQMKKPKAHFLAGHDIDLKIKFEQTGLLSSSS